MASIYIMPRQGQSVESCVMTEWLKKEGDAVAVGDVLFSYETDKSSFEEKSEVAGTLLRCLVSDGDDVPCLDPVAIIGEPGEDISALLAEIAAKKGGAPSAPAAEAAPAVSAETASPVATASAATSAAAPIAAPAASMTEDGRLRISPRARNLAEKTDADLSRAVGTGPMGRIIERDVNALLDAGMLRGAAAPAEDAVSAPVQAAVAPEAAYEDVKLPNIRRVIAKSMHASLSNMAQLTLNASFDATQIMAFRARLKEKAEALGLNNITLNDIVLYAVAKTLPGHRDLNANYLDTEEKMRYFKDVHLGIAVDTERGLLVPVVPNANRMSLNDLAGASKAVIRDAQSGSISPDKLKGASFTVTNLGSMGVESFTPVINPPQTGILGVDTITYRVKADGSTYPAMGLSLTFDHRALDGAPAARFLHELCVSLENFNLLLAK